MKIMLLSDVQAKGGAGIAAHRLALAFSGHGHEVLWATPHPDPVSPFQTINCREFSAPGKAVRRIALTLRPGQRRAVDSQAIARRVVDAVKTHKPDVVHVHNLHGTDLPATLPAELSRRVPVVWTLHDMWAFTGTCAYSMDCRKFESACDGVCPMADTYPASDRSAIPTQFQQRRQAFSDAGRLAFATPSRWLADEAQRGMLAGHTVQTIHNCVELDRYKPIERSAARQALDLPDGRPVLVSAATPGDPRKGAAVLYQALALLGRPNTILLQLGGSMPKDLPGKWDHRVLSDIHDPRLMRLAYSAGVAHVLPTLADNLPNTLLEASACGVPSIGSNVGGVGEAIIDGQTGWLVPANDPDALAKRIGLAIDESGDVAEERRRACRVFAESTFAPANQAQRYVELFTDTIALSATPRPVFSSSNTTKREAA
jgi:glycosyltransferase involved in cell wall biosynthesis